MLKADGGTMAGFGVPMELWYTDRGTLGDDLNLGQTGGSIRPISVQTHRLGRLWQTGPGFCD